MLYHWLYPLSEQFILFNVLKYITFRTFMGLFTGMAIVFALGRPWIDYLKRRQFLQTLWQYVPQNHHNTKTQTPTLGGILICFAILVSSLLWARLDNPLIWLMLGLGLAFAAIGTLDDYFKIVRKDAHGLRARYKFPLQLLVSLGACFLLYDVIGLEKNLTVPFFKEVSFYLGAFYILFGALVLTGASNAVNLTDGLDGLVTGPAIIAFLAYGVFAYIAGNAKISGYLAVPYIPDCAEVAIVCGAVAGALIGFLWFNAHPAEVFMGDVGALAIGGMLGLAALLTKHELLLVVIGGVFVLETLSVITQVVSFKLTGKRIFRMAPLHHHFELKGWPESKVIVRFWIISIILALASLSTLKLR